MIRCILNREQKYKVELDGLNQQSSGRKISWVGIVPGSFGKLQTTKASRCGDDRERSNKGAWYMNALIVLVISSLYPNLSGMKYTPHRQINFRNLKLQTSCHFFDTTNKMLPVDVTRLACKFEVFPYRVVCERIVAGTLQNHLNNDKKNEIFNESSGETLNK